MARLQELVDAGLAKDGYLDLEAADFRAFLFLHGGKTFCAGAIEENRLVARSLGWFFSVAPEARKATFFGTDLPLFLCMAVLFRKAPSAVMPANLMDGEALLARVKSNGTDSVLVVRKGESRSLVFCHAGTPAAIYPAPGEVFPAEGTVSERILEYVYTPDPQQREVSLDLYDEIKLPPDREGNRPLQTYEIKPRTAAREERFLLVKLGARIVFRFPVDRDQIHVGRSGENDLVLDNLSVSRVHALITQQTNARIHIVDRDSENGLNIAGIKVKSATLGVGDEVGIGKYTLQFVDQAGIRGVVAPLPPESRPDATAGFDRTIAVTSTRPAATIVHDGVAHEMRGQVFLIGKSPSAHLRIKGWFIAEVHVHLAPNTGGGLVVEHVGGRRRVLVNGHPTRRYILQNGDVMQIGKHEFVIHL